MKVQLVNSIKQASIICEIRAQKVDGKRLFVINFSAALHDFDPHSSKISKLKFDELVQLRHLRPNKLVISMQGTSLWPSEIVNFNKSLLISYARRHRSIPRTIAGARNDVPLIAVCELSLRINKISIAAGSHGGP